MSFAIKLHAIIERVNPLSGATQSATNFLLAHPTLYKIVLLVNHLFRAITMAFFMLAVPMALCFGASLFYRLTVENNCAYKFALPAFVGGVALPPSQTALAQLISGSAFKSLAFFRHSILLLVPYAAYLTYVILTVDYDVDQRCR